MERKTYNFLSSGYTYPIQQPNPNGGEIMKLPKIPFFTLGSSETVKTSKEEADLKIRNDQDDHHGREKRSIRYRTSIDHKDDLNEFDQFKDSSMNR